MTNEEILKKEPIKVVMTRDTDFRGNSTTDYQVMTPGWSIQVIRTGPDTQEMYLYLHVEKL